MGKKNPHYQDIEFSVFAALLYATSRREGPLPVSDRPTPNQVEWVRQFLDGPFNTEMFAASAIRRSSRFLQNPVTPELVPLDDGTSEKAQHLAIANGCATWRRPPYLPPKPSETPQHGVERAKRLLAACLLERKRSSDEFQPGFPYVKATHRCFKCGSETPTYSWVGQSQWTARVPPRPHPPTLRTATTAEGGSYWANYCSHCPMVLGDWYVFYFEAQRSLPQFAVVDLEDPQVRASRPTPALLEHFLRRARLH